MSIEKVKQIVEQSTIYSTPECDETICIDYCDSEEVVELGRAPGRFYGTGEDSGANYEICYDEVNLAEDTFYKLVEVTA